LLHSLRPQPVRITSCLNSRPDISDFRLFPLLSLCFPFLFFFNDTPPTEIYTLSLHDALPICNRLAPMIRISQAHEQAPPVINQRSEEHTSELQSRRDLVCRLLLEKKKKYRSDRIGG